MWSATPCRGGRERKQRQPQWMHHEREADLPEYLQSTGVRVNGVQYDTRRLEQNAPRHLDLLQTLNYPNEDLVGTDCAKRSPATLGSLPRAIPPAELAMSKKRPRKR